MFFSSCFDISFDVRRTWHLFTIIILFRSSNSIPDEEQSWFLGRHSYDAYSALCLWTKLVAGETQHHYKVYWIGKSQRPRRTHESKV